MSWAGKTQLLGQLRPVQFSEQHPLIGMTLAHVGSSMLLLSDYEIWD